MEKQGSEQQEELRSSQEKRAQQPQANPVAVLLEWSGKKGTYALSVLLAIIGVAGGMVPYFAAGNMVVGIFNAVRDWSFYVQWACIAAVSYAVQIIFHHLSTTVSHIATFATIANLRIRLAQKLTRIPMGYVLDTPSGTLKRLLVEKVDSIKRAKAELEKQRDETKVALTNQKQAESALQEKIRQQNDLIAKTKNDEAEYTKYASERSSQKAELQKQQQDMIQAQILRAARAAGGGAIPQAIAGTSSYPWNDANCYVDGNAVSHGGADGNGGDGYGYGCRQCVSYAAWKLRATKGISAAYWGNAKNVPASARNAGFRTGSTPKAGSFGVMTGGQYGHIVWVESVNGNMVTISQYNYLVNGRWGQFSTMTVPASTYDTYVYFD